ncbi:MAG: NAD(P)-binding domain-containing protein [bacterium]
MKRIAIIGAGPIGLETALYASKLGYEFEIFEKGEIGFNILNWGHVTLFSPWSMNHSSLGVALLEKYRPEWLEPAQEDYLTGKEYVETYLWPLSTLPQLNENIHTGTCVEFIGREGILKGDLVGGSDRAAYPFRILTVNSQGVENCYSADIVIDASGVYGNHNWLGDGGIPALGEKESEPHIGYGLEDICGADRSKYAGKKTLLVGTGYSAATAISDFHKLIHEEPHTSVLWAIRESRQSPIPLIEEDPLPNRAKLTEIANTITRNGQPQVEFRNNTIIDSIQYLEHGEKFVVGLRTNGLLDKVEVDRVIANVGYGPDNSVYRELQVHECYATRGPMKLAAALLGGSATDCLAQTSHGSDTLKNPEPNFYIIGNKSYGRNSTFLIHIGLSQIQEVFTLITGDAKLNLYQVTQKEKKTS